VDIGLIDDMPAVKAFITQDEIWECMEDGVTKDAFYPSNDALSQWLVCVDEGKVIGMILTHNDTSSAIKMHPYMLSKYKHKGREMMKMYYGLFMDLPETINKLNVSIPEYQTKVINFAKKVGFIKEGINREAYNKNNIFYNVINMGLTRSEIRGLV